MFSFPCSGAAKLKCVVELRHSTRNALKIRRISGEQSVLTLDGYGYKDYKQNTA